MKSTILVILLIYLFSSTIWNVCDAGGAFSHKSSPSQPSIKKPNVLWLGEFLSLFSASESIHDINEYDRKLSTYNLNRKVLFNYLVILSQSLIYREKEISIFIGSISHTHLNFRHYLKKLLDTSDNFDPKINGLIENLDADLVELSSHASIIATEYSIKNMPSLGGLDNLFNPSVVSIDDCYSTEYYALFNCLCKATASYELFVRLEYIFSKFKSEYYLIKKEPSCLNISVIIFFNTLRSNMEVRVKNGKRAIEGILQFQKLYLSTYFLLKRNFREENVNVYKKTLDECTRNVCGPPISQCSFVI